MTVDDLIAAGYMKFFDSQKARSLGDWYQTSYQRRVMDAVGTRYFITISHSLITMPGHETRESFEASNQFTLGGENGQTFEVTMLYHNETREQMEKFFHDLWTNMRLDYYEADDDRRLIAPRLMTADEVWQDVERVAPQELLDGMKAAYERTGKMPETVLHDLDLVQINDPPCFRLKNQTDK